MTDTEKRLREIDQELYQIVAYLTGVRLPWDPMPPAVIMARMYRLNQRWFDQVMRYHELMQEERELIEEQSNTKESE